MENKAKKYIKRMTATEKGNTCDNILFLSAFLFLMAGGKDLDLWRNALMSRA